MEDLLTASATTLVRSMQAGALTPLAVLEAHIARIQEVNPAINALVTPLFDRAREDARRLEAHGDRAGLPLFGLPVTVKDALAVAGARFTAGTAVYRDRIAAGDAEVVKRVRAAGAIVLGKTNCPDMSSSAETNNLVFGLTRNPWHAAHSAGGSSGGEAALIAAGGSPLGLGSDVAGSVRIPAAFCGVCALKPSANRVSTIGHEPAVPRTMAGWLTVGPLARRVEDLALVLSVLSEVPVADYAAVDLAGRRLIIPEAIWGLPLAESIKGALRRAAGALDAAGMRVVDGVRLPFTRLAFEIAAIVYRDWSPDLRRDLGGGQVVRVLPELIANRRGRGRVAPNTLAMLFVFSTYGPVARAAGFGRFERVAAIQAEILDAMGPGGLLLWPVFPTPAPRHGFSWGRTGPPSYTPAFNALGCPAVALPVGWSPAGRGRHKARPYWSPAALPLAVQVVARPGEDETALAAAAALEAAFGGWRLAPSHSHA